MWFLEHESLFGGKRVWLRPGSQQLFGRTKSGDDEGKSWKIDNKAVSRKHVMLKVHDAPPQNGTKLHTRSQIEITDLSCRQGTTIDEKTHLKSKKLDDGSLEYDKAILTGTEHTIRLAQGYAPFKIVWRPTVFTHASRESKESKARSAQLHALDIKTTTDFLFDKTTHVITQKRNLPKVLSGLVAGKHIVTGEFLDAVLKAAATSVDEAENYEPSKLEEDFDEWWPKEKDYVPPVGAEPVTRPQEMLEPDPSRAEVFSGLTFIFLVESQFNSLLEPVSGGGGKGLFFDVKPGETTVEEYVDYVHSVAGKKKRTKTSGDKLPIVTVRLAGYPDGMEEWAAGFVTGVDQALQQRSILQNEFLDAIVTKDRASLQRPPAEIVNIPSRAPGSAPSQPSVRDPTPMSHSKAPSPAGSASPEITEPVKTTARKRIHRPRTGGRFTGFDDFEPPAKRTKVDDTPMQDVQESTRPSISQAAASQRRTGHDIQTQHSQGSPVDDIVAKEEQMDTLFPAAAAIKRQRAATRAPSASVEPEAGGPVQPTIGKGKETIEKLQRAQARAASKEFNVREQARIRVKEEEERRKADEESLAEALDGVDISQIRNITEIEEMDVRPRADRALARQSQVNSDRWNPEWNGRKNFKKFKRRGVERGVQAHRTIIRLEEAAPKKGFGVGDAFLLDDVEPSLTFRSNRSRRLQDDDDSEPEVGGFVSRKRSQTSEVVNVEESGEEDGDEGPVGRTQRSSGRTQRVVETQIDDTQTQARGKKRGAATVAGPTSKRGKLSRREDDSDEEETGFRFKRRG
ncbi:hypothetical protein HBI56_003800 [Parastagonospora nodorum]|nr:hypothetical protein HBH74_010060 [Parastagonospora nodorum]KAH4996907.1 hypothetical protein HBH73_003490 [Parastagonospora nodorum]KAH5270220.1 hypothetical protein HBI71_062450 [Parastagonospora nodorum]KAH5690777.1 hypothetical protein HBI23_014060 [Parastagonospora nodorum]KAH6099259.1 hypothetical protein HBI65_067480 [Parastagonospora nodorum]